LLKKTNNLLSCFLLALCLAPFGGKASVPDSLYKSPSDASQNAIRTYAVAGTQVAAYTLSLVALNQAWYKDFPKSSFHFHNDLPDWFQQDKLGHFTSTYHISRITSATYNWAGLSNNRSAWIGALSGTALLTAVEIFDGFSAEWGFSVADAVANKLGAALFLTQQLTWQEQRFIAKYSYSHSGLAYYRPSILGSNLAEYMLKDYNGQTFWLSMNLSSTFFPDSKLPQWLNLAIGHGAYGMLGSIENPHFVNGTPMPALERYRQWYIAPDIDLSRIPVQSPWLKAVLSGLNFFKFPAPAIEYNHIHGVRFHWLFF
jgi:uncharacterized protein YfiM (DUF2279 family)